MNKQALQSISYCRNRNQTIPWSVGLAGLIYVTQYALELAEVFPLNGRKKRRRKRRDDDEDDEDEGIYGQVGRLLQSWTKKWSLGCANRTPMLGGESRNLGEPFSQSLYRWFKRWEIWDNIRSS